MQWGKYCFSNKWCCVNFISIWEEIKIGPISYFTKLKNKINSRLVVLNEEGNKKNILDKNTRYYLDNSEVRKGFWNRIQKTTKTHIYKFLFLFKNFMHRRYHKKCKKMKYIVREDICNTNTKQGAHNQNM